MSFQIMRDATTHKMLRYGANVGTPGANEELMIIQDDSLLAQLSGVASVIVNNDNTIVTTAFPTTIIKEDAPGVADVALVTNDATPTALVRFTIPTQTMYVANFKLRGIDTGNGNRRYIDATYMVARVNAAAVIDMNVVNFNGFNNPTSQAWGVVASIDPNANSDFVIQVTGQAARQIEWVLKTTVHRFRPQGL